MSRQAIIDVAAAENGTVESPANSNKTKYGEWYGLNGVKWCAIFVSWVYDQAGHRLERVDREKGYQSCQSGFNFWKRNGCITKEPQLGDIVLFDWGGDGVCDHTGIFAGWTDDSKRTLTAWEGNTAKGNNSDGGKVMLRERARSLVKAFVTPMALNTNLITSVNRAMQPVVDDDILQMGDTGSDVISLQKMLFDLGCKITVDGDFGPATKACVQEFQTKHSLEATGIVTPEILGVIQEEVTTPKVSGKKITSGSYLSKGDGGVAVLALQKALNGKGANPAVDEDGIFGKDTYAALKAYQQQNGLDADGIAGPKTFAALELNI